MPPNHQDVPFRLQAITATVHMPIPVVQTMANIIILKKCRTSLFVSNFVVVSRMFVSQNGILEYIVCLNLTVIRVGHRQSRYIIYHTEIFISCTKAAFMLFCTGQHSTEN